MVVSRIGDSLRRNEKLIALSGATFLVMAGQGIVAPVLPLYAKDFGVGTTMVGMTVTAFALARLLLNVPAGMIADRFGRRSILIGGPLITAVGMIGSGVAESIWTLLAWRFVAGAGSAFYMSGAMVYLIDIARPEQLSRFVATNQWALSLGIALGPGLGGWAAERWGLATPFFIVGATTLVAGVYSLVRLPETREAPDADPGGAGGPGAVRSDDESVDARSIVFSAPFLLLAATAMTIFVTRAGTRGTLMPLRADATLGWGPSEIGWLFMLTGGMTLFTLLPAGRAADTIGRRWVILFSGVLAGAGAITVGLSPTTWAFVLGNFIMSLGTGTAGPAPAAFVADITPPHLRGLMVGMYRSAGDVGVVVGPVALGYLSDQTSIGFAIVVAGVLVAAAGIAFFLGTANIAAAGRQR